MDDPIEQTRFAHTQLNQGTTSHPESFVHKRNQFAAMVRFQPKLRGGVIKTATVKLGLCLNLICI